jgi:hypothetical protein
MISSFVVRVSLSGLIALAGDDHSKPRSAVRALLCDFGGWSNVAPCTTTTLHVGRHEHEGDVRGGGIFDPLRRALAMIKRW